MKEVGLWSVSDVSDWLSEEGLLEYSEVLRNTDGAALLKLSELDFQNPPLSLVSGDKGRQILERLETLRVTERMGNPRNHREANGHIANGKAHNGEAKTGESSDKIQIHIPLQIEDVHAPFPTEWTKTGMAFLYAVCCFTTTSVVISIVHERVPSKEESPPLPDKFFDVFDRVQWAFSICEINGMLLVALWFIQWIHLKHRSIVGRRFFFIVGTLYLYRCVTMYVTVLPVPGMHFKCSPKLLGDYEAQMRRVMKMISGGGLSITGSHNLCGDYLYSGHTVMLTLTYLFIKEYSSRQFWIFDWLCWSLSVSGIFCILLAHDHYTVDVVVAYFVTTRLFWWYHAMANQQCLKQNSKANTFSRVWWFRFFCYMEQNVQGAVPCHYQPLLPWRPFLWFPLLCRTSSGGRVKYNRLDSL